MESIQVVLAALLVVRIVEVELEILREQGMSSSEGGSSWEWIDS